MEAMNLWEAIQSGKRFRYKRCPHNDGGPGVWYRVRNDIGLWVHYDECGTAVKNDRWLTTEQILSEDWEIEDGTNYHPES